MRSIARDAAALGLLLHIAFAPTAAQAQAPGAAPSDIAALKAEIEALKALVPSQSHAMADVDYHFSNLWFAAANENWPLAQFYLNETRSHLRWAVRIRPVRRLSTGGEFDLRPMLQGVESHQTAEKPYLRPRIPEAPSSRMIDFRPARR
jgi:hypothetical protein